MTFRLSLLVFLNIALCNARVLGAEGDVYNFYFQKAPGPQTVYQGSQNSSIVAPSESRAPEKGSSGLTPPQSLISQVPSETSAANPGGWAFQFGLTQRETRSGIIRTGPTLGLTKGFNRHLGLDLSLMLATSFSDEQTHAIYDANWQLVAANSNKIFPSLALALTPFNFSSSGRDAVEFALLVGAMAGSTEIDIHHPRALQKKPSHFVGFAGARFIVHISKTVGLQASARFNNADQGEIGEGNLSVNWQL